MKQLTLIALLALGAAAAQSGAADSKSPPEVPPASMAPVPAGAYTLDKAHSSLVMRLDHLGFSHFTARFTRFDADLKLDPANLAASSVKVNVDPHSLDSDNAPAGFMDQLRGNMWLDVAKYPQITFRSTKVEKVGAKGVRITGDLTLHGVTRPISGNVSASADRYVGSTTVSQRDFGIEPIAVAGGLVKVKNEVRIDFAIASR